MLRMTDPGDAMVSMTRNELLRLLQLSKVRPTSEQDLRAAILLQLEANSAGDDNNAKPSSSHAGAEQPAHRAAGQKVFDVPELLESILIHVPPIELIRAAMISKGTADLLKLSPKLVKRISSMTRPDYSSYFRIPLLGTPPSNYVSGIEFYSEQTVRMAARTKVTITLVRRESPLPSIGQLGRSVLIVQPPALQATILPECCVNYRPKPRASSTGCYAEPKLQENISSSSGLTIGDVLDALIEVRRQHRLCPFAAKAMHDNAGFVKTGVSFTIGIDVRYAPALAPAVLQTQRVVFSRGLDDYIDTRLERKLRSMLVVLFNVADSRVGQATGHAVPTFEEYLEDLRKQNRLR